MARAIKLIDAPIGLFEVDGILVLKTEYSTRHEDGTITPDCYIIESGEYFWGGVDSVEERNNLEVAPVDMPTLTPQNEWVSVEQAMPPEHEPVLCIVSGKPKPNIMLEDAYQLGSWNKADGWIIDEWLDWEGANVTWWMKLPEPPDRRPPEGEEDK